MELPDLMKNLSTESDVLSFESKVFKSVSAEINDIPTDFVWANFNNCIFLIVTQFKKIGPLILIEKDQLSTVSGQKHTSFDSKILLGACDLEILVAGRFLVENLKIEKPFYLFSSLKDYNKETLNAVKDVCLDVFSP